MLYLLPCPSLVRRYATPMARKIRLEFPGAIYHVINRGNYRSWIFENEKAKEAFVQCLFDVCERAEWRLHAFVVMGNHFHLAVETPRGNLVSGMQWLQSTFANRFNRLRKERGHVFQGRYKSLVVEAGNALGQVCHYLHLNPVRAGIVTTERLRDYRFSSYWYLWQPKQRPKFLDLQSALTEPSGLADEPRGWRAYESYLTWQANTGPAGKNSSYVSLSRGWAIGASDFKQALLKEQAATLQSRTWGSRGAVEVKRARWAAALAKALSRIGEKLRQDRRKSAPWKVAVAAHLKATTDVSNAWLAEKLIMGSGFYVSKHVGLARKNPKSPAAQLATALQKGKR